MRNVAIYLVMVLAIPALTFGNTHSASDSIDVLHYEIHVDTIDKSSQEIRAHTIVTFVPKVSNISSATLDLLGLTVDSIYQSNSKISFTHDDTLIRAFLSSAANPTDTIDLTIWYKEKPPKDGSGFGGFYFSAGYAFNIGVGFLADPHNYGRVWFPCKDNFTDKSTYDFHITTSGEDVAACSGELISATPNPDSTTTWHWELTDPINTYLASMAVTEYVAVRDTYYSATNDTIPIAYYVKSADSLDAIGTFQGVKTAMQAFEFWYGPFLWQRVGYVGVPFNAGAMEHASNIAFPVAVINGTTQFQDLMSHELAHNWFGNLVTCSEAGEMWLNEGLASYCEAIFREFAYGKDDFKNYVRSNLNTVLRKTHIDDGTYLPVSGVDHDHTYGSTVYDKGALVAHTLRGYLGDTLYRQGMKQYMADFAFGNANSDSLQSSLEQTTGVSLNDFFTGWVKTAGFPHFEVSSFESQANQSKYDVTVNLRQRFKGGNATFDSNHIDLRFLSEQQISFDTTINFSGASASPVFTVDFDPAVVLIDPEEKITDATTDNYYQFDSAEAHVFPSTYCTVTMNSLQDSAFVRITHNWIAPDGFKQATNGVRLSDSRYWKVETIWQAGTHASATLTYSGIVSSTNTLAFLDHTWLTNGEDSLILFYRSSPADEWEEVDGYTLITGSLIDKKGTVELDTLKPGEYTLGTHDASYISRGDQLPPNSFVLYPNPADEIVSIRLEIAEPVAISIHDLRGGLQYFKQQSTKKRTELIKIGHFSSGTYIVSIRDKRGFTASKRLILAK